MGFKDIFKKSFFEGFASGEIDTKTILIALAVTSAIAVYIFFIYKLVTRNKFYSKNFNISLAVISIITASVILTIQSSIVISLGMVGALSIVRFRTAVKDPMDLAFLFWAISNGIICGAGLAEIAIITSLCITAGIFVLDIIPVGKASMLLVVNASDAQIEDEIIGITKKYSKYQKVKSRNITAQQLDIIVEVRVKNESSFIKEISAISGVVSVSLISHDGEVSV